ncbi:MAG TPA: OmpA family protein [Bacteroidales bacterium]|nr:OmpA family protein [Bacteroidales bacterium]
MHRLFLFFSLNFFGIIYTQGQPANYIISKASFSSPDFDEFSPVFFNGDIVFCSNRQARLFSSYSTPENKSFFKLYEADTLQGSKWQESRILPGQVNSNLNNGPATFSRNGDTMYFSRNLVIEGSNKKITGKGNKLGLFTSVLKNGEWTDVKEMRFNDNSWNITTPYLSPDGKRLFFASDKPGGYGGSDLYYSDWKNGFWDNPVNLGKPVNTPGNEAYPFVNIDGSIFFSSDSLPGKGGKDIFYSQFADTSWIEPVNLNAPINSKWNDFGFITDGVVRKGYFSSDRNGNLDIFSFRTIWPQFLFCEKQRENNFCISFPDDASIDIDPLSLQFTWDFGDGQKTNGYIVQHCYSKPGKYSVKQSITDKKTGKIVFLKSVIDVNILHHDIPEIIAPEPVITGKETSLSASFNIPDYEASAYFWDINNNPAGKGQSIKYVFGEGRTSVKLLAYLKEKTSGKERSVCIVRPIESNVRGNNNKTAAVNNSIQLNLSEDAVSNNVVFSNIYSAADEVSGKAVFAVQIFESANAISASDGIFRDISSKYDVKRIRSGKGYAFLIDEQMNFMPAYPSYKDAIASGFRDVKIITYMPADTAESELWNFKRTYGLSGSFYFVNNGTSISKDAIPVLDRLILLLKRNPGLKIMVAAHTDNTGSAGAEIQLSEKQAKSIVDYLVLNGISRSRLSSKGYGSSRPVAAQYPESEKLKNRRVDFIKIE